MNHDSRTESVDFSLEALGFTPFFQSQTALLGGGLVPARVAAEHRGHYALLAPDGPFEATVTGRLRHEAKGRLMLPAVGDWVAVRVGERPQAVIHHVFARATQFVRKAAGESSEAQIIGANVDLVAIVMSLNSDVNLRRMDRYLAAVRASGAAALIVLSKSDLAADPARALEDVTARARGVPVVLASALRREGLDDLRERLAPGDTLALVGSSGVGKSSLTNLLLGREAQAVKQIRESDDRGQHATTHRELFVLPGGGLLIDTPGMRELGLFAGDGHDDAGDALFTSLAADCRYRDCTHQGEPFCAVARAVEQGRLDAEELASHLKLSRELARERERQDVRAQAASKRDRKLQAKALRRHHGSR